jgi:hypothetical protein
MTSTKALSGQTSEQPVAVRSVPHLMGLAGRNWRKQVDALIQLRSGLPTKVSSLDDLRCLMHTSQPPTYPCPYFSGNN